PHLFLPPPSMVPMGLACGIIGAVFLARGRFSIGGAMCALGMGLLSWPSSIWVAPAAQPLGRRRRRILLLVVCATAVFFRAYRLEPPGLWGDDALNGLLAFDVLDGR